jgi:hypothetical protein
VNVYLGSYANPNGYTYDALTNLKIIINAASKTAKTDAEKIKAFGRKVTN